MSESFCRYDADLKVDNLDNERSAALDAARRPSEPVFKADTLIPENCISS